MTIGGRALTDNLDVGPGTKAPGARNADGVGKASRVPAIDAAAGPGKALPSPLQAKMEGSFGADFSAVRVHEGPQARDVRASAYAHGNDLHFAPGQYDPASQSGQELIGHELTHVVQQRAGSAVPQGKGAAVNADDGLEAEADMLGARAVAGESVRVAGQAHGGIQRKLDPSALEQLRGQIARIAPQRGATPAQAEAALRLIDQRFARIEDPVPVIAAALDHVMQASAPSPSSQMSLDSRQGKRSLPSEDSDDALDDAPGFDSDEDIGDAPDDSDEELDDEPGPVQPASAMASDTEGSDTEDERQYQANRDRRKADLARTTSVSTRLKSHLYVSRLEKMGPDTKEQDRIDTMFGKAQAPRPGKDGEVKQPKKPKSRRPTGTLYRKQAAFAHPGESVPDRVKLPPPTPQERAALDQLNQLLGRGVPLQKALQQVPDAQNFLVAQYRGMWYAPSKFTPEQRRGHRQLNERNRPIYSQAALKQGPLGVAGYYELYNNPARTAELARYQADLNHIGMNIRTALQNLNSQRPTREVEKAVGRDGDRLRPQGMGDLSTHFYSQSYDPYHQGLASARQRAGTNQPSQPLDPIYQGLPNDGNPKVSTGDVPVHAEKYAYGIKPYKGHEDDVLEPQYNEQGRPARPYSGKSYTSLHPLTDYDPETGPTQLVPLQNAHRINIDQMIINERESQFDGMLEGDRVAEQYKAKFPNFAKGYKEVFGQKYGMSRELFQAFATAMTRTTAGSDERIYVEALLSSFLAHHSELRAIEDADRIARERGSRLVYRTGPSSFGFTPPPIERAPANKGKGKAKAHDDADDEGSEPKPRKRLRTQGPSAPLPRLDLKTKLTQVTQGQADSSARGAEPAFDGGLPPDLHQQVATRYGAIVDIDGDGLNCYIRSLVTGASLIYGALPANQIDNMVDNIAAHLAAVQLRTRVEMINAGGLVAAEVRRALTQLAGHPIDLQVHVVQWDATQGQLIDFVASEGNAQIWLLYTPGHFSLIRR